MAPLPNETGGHDDLWSDVRFKSPCNEIMGEFVVTRFGGFQQVLPASAFKNL